MIVYMMARMLVAVIFAALASACSTGPKATFEVQVKNVSSTPISVGLTKRMAGGQRPAIEEGWVAPEDIAMRAPALADRRWGELLKPGETTVLGPFTGTFPAGVLAVLRVYAGNPTVEEMLAISRNDPDRLDVSLWPGRSEYLINDPGGRLMARRAGE